MKLNVFDLKTVQHSYTSANYADGEARRTVRHIERAEKNAAYHDLAKSSRNAPIAHDLAVLAYEYNEAQKKIADLRSEVHALTEECHECADGADGARVVRDGKW
jgi:hypothetical protein